MNFYKIFLFIPEYFLPSFLSGVHFFFILDLSVSISIIRHGGMFFAAVSVICRLCFLKLLVTMIDNLVVLFQKAI